MPSLRSANRVIAPVGVRSLAALAGMQDAVSLRELIVLLGPGGFGPTPVYLIGHNTNSAAEVRTALAGGANAVEIDITAYESDLTQLCIDHAGLTGDAPGHDEAPRFADFLRDLRVIADEWPEQLALVVFDCKPPAATPEHGRTMIDAIRRILTVDSDLNIIVSVADVTSSHPYRLDGTSVFDRIAATLGPREGLMIDADDDPEGVAAFFAKLGVTRFCYGNGTSFPVSDEAAMVYRTPIEQACWMRIAHDGPRFVYAWTVNGRANQRLYLRAGVNGIIADPRGIEHFVQVLAEPAFAASHRLATRLDNPMLPVEGSYGLGVSTSDIAMAGTDAGVTFTVTGANGAASVAFEGHFNRRLERGSRTCITLPSPDLGELHSVAVQRDDSGNAPDWHLASISVDSHRYRTRRTAAFDCWIDSTAAFARPLA